LRAVPRSIPEAQPGRNIQRVTAKTRRFAKVALDENSRWHGFLLISQDNIRQGSKAFFFEKKKQKTFDY